MGANSITICGTDHQIEGDDMAENNPPDLRTLEGQLSFLDYHRPDEAQMAAHETVNTVFQKAWEVLANVVQDGPGKTRLLHAMQNARMTANCVIANHGA